MRYPNYLQLFSVTYAISSLMQQQYWLTKVINEAGEKEAEILEDLDTLTVDELNESINDLRKKLDGIETVMEQTKLVKKLDDLAF